MDGEHSGIDFADVKLFLRAAESVGVPVIIRLNRPDDITALNELGVAGFQFPHVQNAEQARMYVERVKYAPVGWRGFASTLRAQKYDMTKFEDYYKFANEETLLLVQIEEKQGIENMEEIIAVEGVDVIVTGKGDISQSQGVIGDVFNPKVDAVKNRIMEVAAKYNKPTLVVGKDREDWINLVKNKNVAIAEYIQDIDLLLNGAIRARKDAEYLKDARQGKI